MRHAVEGELRTLIDRVAAAALSDPGAAMDLLTAHWARLAAEQAALDASCGAQGIELEGRLAMRLMAHWAALGDPAFDELPMRAAGLSCDDDHDGAPLWIGTGAELLRAAQAARRRGLRMEVDLEHRLSRLFRGERLVAILVEDPDHVALPRLAGADDFTGARRVHALVMKLRHGLDAAAAAIPDP